jgi:hypothetical protein
MRSRLEFSRERLRIQIRRVSDGRCDEMRCDAMRCDSTPLFVTAPLRIGELERRLGRFETRQEGGREEKFANNTGAESIISDRLRELAVELCVLACEDAVCVGCRCFAIRRIPILLLF